MRKRIICLLLGAALLLALFGCSGKPEDVQLVVSEDAVTWATEATVPATIAPDGDSSDVTCKGSYTSEADADTVVARMEGAELTNRELGVWYWASVAQYRQEVHGEGPDFTKPLDSQPCAIDDSVNSWQQYFLRQALTAWHTTNSLIRQAAEAPVPTEEAYIPNADTHERCMTGMPVTSILYGYQKTYIPNSMHQTYLDTVPQSLEQLAVEKGYSDAGAMAEAAFGCSADTLTEMVRDYNYGYSYITFLNYGTMPTLEEAEQWYSENQAMYEAMGITRDSARCVDIRHVLLVPESETPEATDACVEQAEKLLNTWKHKTKQTEAGFSEVAYRNSQDDGTAANGGSYSRILPGNLPEPLDMWCFDASREVGDTGIITTEQGVHIVYFAGSTPVWQLQAQEDLAKSRYLQQMEAIREKYPVEVDYRSICLIGAQADVAYTDVLYPDIAHERYPEVPVYLQQDYPHTWYGNYMIASHGCGITTFSMLTTYMSDEEWTPPEMCDRYGNYSFVNGTDGMLFVNEPSSFGYFFKERTYEPSEAKQALLDGYIVVSIQQKGYWTGGGHYILLERIKDDGMVQVRDSNIANYFKLPNHKNDGHEWQSVTGSSMGYWIFEPKITHVEACGRCGNPQDLQQPLLRQEYLCEKCRNALIRRNAYLNG